MKKQILLPVGLLILAFGISMFLVDRATEAQMPGPQGPPSGARPTMMAGMLNIEAQWAFVSFELDIDDATLVKCRKIYREAYLKNKEIREKMVQARGDANAMRNLRSESDKLKNDLEAKLKTVLTQEQMNKISAWEKESQQRMRRAFQQGSQGRQQQ